MPGERRAGKGRIGRTMTVLALGGRLAGPALAGGRGGGDDVETVRARVLEAIDYEISLLERNQAVATADAVATYAEGIAELRALRERATAATETATLWASTDRVHAVDEETRRGAGEVGNGEPELLAEARRKTLEVVDHELGCFSLRRDTTDDAELRCIYGAAVAELRELHAEAAATVAELEVIRVRPTRSTPRRRPVPVRTRRDGRRSSGGRRPRSWPGSDATSWGSWSGGSRCCAPRPTPHDVRRSSRSTRPRSKRSPTCSPRSAPPGPCATWTNPRSGPRTCTGRPVGRRRA